MKRDSTYLEWILSRIALTVLFILLFTFNRGAAQEIIFGQYDNYALTVTKMNDLDYGMVINNSGSHQINLTDPDKVILLITGVNYLDIIVDIQADPELLLNGNGAFAGDPQKSIPLTLEAAYANQGQDNTSQAQFFNMAANQGSERFPVRSREYAAPGPPPTPPHEGFTPPQETAYVYLYGSINVGSVDAGSYSAQINVTVTYN